MAVSRYNISRWALEHRALTRYLMVVLLALGAAAYFQLGQDEDPPFTFRAMVVRAFWPGASAQQAFVVRSSALTHVIQTVRRLQRADQSPPVPIALSPSSRLRFQRLGCI